MANPIYDNSLSPSQDRKPSWMSIGERRFEVSWEYVVIPDRYSGDMTGWQASAVVNGFRFKGDVDTPLLSLARLAVEIANNLHLRDSTFGMELPLSVQEVLQFQTSR